MIGNLMEVPARIGNSVAQQLVAGYREFPHCVAEVVKNPMDACLQLEPPKRLEDINIIVRYVRNGDDVNLEVIDDVSGGNTEAYSGIVSIAHSADAAFGRRGKQRIGQYDTGRLAMLNHAERLSYEMLPGDNKLRCISFTFDELMAMTAAGKGNWNVVPRPKSHVLTKRGTRLVIHGLGKGTKDPQHDRSPARLVRELAEYIPLELAPRVRVIDLEGNEFPLAERPLVGDKIRLTLHGVHCGPVIVNIGISPKSQGMTGNIRLTTGGSGPTFAEFLRPLVNDKRYGELVREVRYLLTHAQGMGTVEIPDARPYRSPDSNGFKSELYGNQPFVTELLTLLTTSVAPEIARLVGANNTDLTPRTTDLDLIAGVCRHIHQLTGKVPPGVTKVRGGPTTNQHRVTYAVNTGPHIIELEKSLSEGKDPKKLVWDTRNSGGDVNTASGARLEYTPRQVSPAGTTFTLVCRDLTQGNDPEEQVIFTLHILVVEELPLTCSPETMTLLVGERKLIRLANTDRCSGVFRWFMSGQGVTLDLHADTLTAFATGKTVGDSCDITVEDAMDSSRSATCCIRIVDKREVKTQHEPAANEFVWEGHRFIIEIVDYAAVQMHGSLHSLQRGTDYSLIEINIGHPAIRLAKSDDVRSSRFMDCVASAIAEYSLPEAHPPAYCELKAKVLAMLSIPTPPKGKKA